MCSTSCVCFAMSAGGRQTAGEPSENMATALRPDEYKIVVIGALGVGKTSLMMRFITNRFEERISRFISEEKKAVRVKDGRGKEREITLDIWDTAGEAKERRGRGGVGERWEGAHVHMCI